LFHYTGLRGLRGIAESKKIWATNARYLNDKSELDYLAPIAERIIDARKSSKPSEADDLRQLKSNLTFWRTTHSRPGPIFVCSLSEIGNQLSQWRGYCPNGGGVSIEFDSVELHTSMLPRGVMTVKLLYDPPTQEAVVDGLLSHLLYGNLSPIREGVPRIESAKEVFREMLSFVAPAFKHPAFEEEAEWRLIYSGQYSGLFSLMSESHPDDAPISFQKFVTEYREIPKILAPYVALPLTEGDARLNIESITIGPSMDESLF
jgi:hypothetical protein